MSIFRFVVPIEQLADGSQQRQASRTIVCMGGIIMALLARGENGERNTVDRMQVLNEGAKVGVIAV